jgi:L-threonylcarbamoyladenylate synthase
VHVADAAAAARQGIFNPLAEKLAARFWPGALTLVLPRRVDASVSLLVSAGLNSVALRVPSHPVAMALLAAADRPVAAPSANASGRITATSAAHVAAELGEKLDMILDGGATPLGLESTVIGFNRDHAVLLRPGAIPRADIEIVTGPLAAADATIQSPGQLESHYAPDAKLRLNATRVEPGEALLGFGAVNEAWLNLSPRGDLKEAAANLFSMLRDMDEQVGAIAVSPIPESGLGEAINDRLRRAATPRQTTSRAVAPG